MAKFCRKCGTALVDGICPNCSKSVEKEDVNTKKLEEQKDVVEPSKIEKNIEKEEKIEKTTKELETKEIKEEKVSKKEEGTLKNDELTSKTVKVNTDDEDDDGNSQIGEIINKFINIAKNMFKKPVNTIKENLKLDNFNLAIGSIVLNAILFGVFIHVFIDSCLKPFGVNLDNIENLITTVSDNLVKLKNLNIGPKCAIGMGIVSGLIILILYLMHTQVYKKNLNIKKIVVLTGICEAFFSVGLVIAMVASLISPVLALLVFVFFGVMFMIHMHQGYMELTKTNMDKSVYSYMAGMTIPAIGMVLLTLIGSVACLLVVSYSAYNKNTGNISNSIKNQARK